MDRIIDKADLPGQLDSALAEVGAGGQVTVVDRAEAIARIIPARAAHGELDEKATVADLLAFLRGLPKRHAGSWSRDELYD